MSPLSSSATIAISSLSLKRVLQNVAEVYLVMFPTISLTCGGSQVIRPPHPRAVNWRNLTSGPQSTIQKWAGLFTYEESHAGIHQFDHGKAVLAADVGWRQLDLCLHSETPWSNQRHWSYSWCWSSSSSVAQQNEHYATKQFSFYL